MCDVLPASLTMQTSCETIFETEGSAKWNGNGGLWCRLPEFNTIRATQLRHKPHFKAATVRSSVLFHTNAFGRHIEVQRLKVGFDSWIVEETVQPSLFNKASVAHVRANSAKA